MCIAKSTMSVSEPSARRSAALLLGVALLPGCAVVSIAGAVTGAAISVAGTVVSTGVKVTGKVIEKTLDLAVPASKPAL